MTHYLRGSAGDEAPLPIAPDGTASGADLDVAMRMAGLGPWLLLERFATPVNSNGWPEGRVEKVRYLGLLDGRIVSQDGHRLMDCERPEGRWQVIGQVVPAKEG